MTFKEKRKKIKEISSQKRDFLKRLTPLVEKKYRVSMHYEDTLMSDDGKAYVNVDLTKIDSPFSVFSYDKRMDPEIFDYIDTQVYYLRTEIPVVINFDDGGKYSDDLKDKIRKYVKRHYILEYEDKRIEHSKSLLFGALIIAIGVLMLTFHFLSTFLFYKNGENQVFNEISLILSWMFIWQGTDTFVISGHSRRIDIHNSGQLALAEVTFGEPFKKVQ